MKNVKGLKAMRETSIRHIGYRNHTMDRKGPVRIWLDYFGSDQFEIFERSEFDTFFQLASRLGIKMVDQDEVDRETD